ncbi:MAG: hypothetical protein AAGJ35_06620, partial [Myxococcota bacterium]
MRYLPLLCFVGFFATCFYVAQGCDTSSTNNQESSASVEGGLSGDASTQTEKSEEDKTFTKLSFGGYTTVSDVNAHNLVPQDIGEIKERLAQASIDWSEVKRMYEKGKHSVKSDGSIRTLNGFASKPSNFSTYAPELSEYFKSNGICQLRPVPGFKCTEGKFVDEYVEYYAIDGKGPFANASAQERGMAIRSGLLVL